MTTAQTTTSKTSNTESQRGAPGADAQTPTSKRASLRGRPLAEQLQMLAPTSPEIVQAKTKGSAGGSKGDKKSALDQQAVEDRTKVKDYGQPLALKWADIKDLFSKNTSGGWVAKKTPLAPVVLGPGIDPSLATPIGSIARQLSDMQAKNIITKRNESVLVPNMSVRVTLHLKPGGYGTPDYRFTWVGNKITVDVAGGSPPEQNTVKEGVDKKLYLPQLEVAGLKFRASMFHAKQGTILKQALKLTPKPALQKIAGVSFERKVTPKGSKEGGHYDGNTHTIVIYNFAFEQGDSYALRAIAHEIGHAIDQYPLAKAEAAYKKSKPKSAKEQEKEDNKLLGTRSPSGRTFKRSGTIGEDSDHANANASEFRRACTKDGVKVQGKKLMGGITKYSETSWDELYAEAFSYYTTDPGLLKSLKPTIYAYFAKKFPRSKEPPAKPASAGSVSEIIKRLQKDKNDPVLFELAAYQLVHTLVRTHYPKAYEGKPPFTRTGYDARLSGVQVTMEDKLLKVTVGRAWCLSITVQNAKARAEELKRAIAAKQSSG